MGLSLPFHSETAIEFSWSEATGAVGDTVTVLPIVVAVAVLTDLSLVVMVLWFGLFQLVWGLYYGAPISVEPMKALAALILAGTISTGEFLIAGVLMGVILSLIGWTGTIRRVQHLFGPPVVRGIQLGVALILLDTGFTLGVGDPVLAGLAIIVALPIVLSGHVNLSAMVVLALGGLIAVSSVGVPSASVPSLDGMFLFGSGDLTVPAMEATVAQLAMTLGNACLGASVLMSDYFETEVSPDQLASSMGVMNLIAVPFGAFPMCHGSGGIAGKYAFGARTAGSNILLGVAYITLAVFAVGLVSAYPMAILGVILVLVAGQLGLTSLRQASEYWLVIPIGVLGVLLNLGLALGIGILAYVLHRRQ